MKKRRILPWQESPGNGNNSVLYYMYLPESHIVPIEHSETYSLMTLLHSTGTYVEKFKDGLEVTCVPGFHFVMS